MYISIIFFPFFSFLYNLLLGRFFFKKGSYIFSFVFMFFSFLFSFFIFFEVILSYSVSYVIFFNWIISSDFCLNWEFLFDSLTSLMLLVVCIISMLVHIYSFEYMSEDPHIIRFLSYLSLFTFFMLVLITSGNYLQLFLGWEGVGLSSYLLINFWYTRILANKAAMKALIMNRVGDFGLILGISYIYILFKSLKFSVIFSLVPFLKFYYFTFFNFEFYVLDLIVFFLFLGAIGKSAQIGLHTWLPDAMEGPTPVSALIHAATMVTAGVFVILRSSILFEYCHWVFILVVILGSLTAFMSGSIGVVQNDLKKVIAYSTCSQLGYMVFSCGMSNYSIGFFHLFNHAFFKALLFLSAGSIIHALSDEQDMRKMGGLLNLLPYTYVMILIGSLSLMGFPFLTGFYSKDLLLEMVYSNYWFFGSFSYWLGTFSAFLTSFYSIRLICLSFLGNSINFTKLNIIKVHEPSFFMVFPMFILCLGSIFIGYFFKDFFVGFGSLIWNNCFYIFFDYYYSFESEFLFFYVKIIPIIFSIFGFLFSLFFYLFYNNFKYNIISYYNYYSFYSFLSKKWYFDNIYNNYFVRYILFFSYFISFKYIDRGFVELFGPLGIVRFFSKVSFFFSCYQTGFIYHYMFSMLLGLIFIIFIYFFTFFFYKFILFFILLFFFFSYLLSLS